MPVYHILVYTEEHALTPTFYTMIWTQWTYIPVLPLLILSRMQWRIFANVSRPLQAATVKVQCNVLFSRKTIKHLWFFTLETNWMGKGYCCLLNQWFIYLKVSNTLRRLRMVWSAPYVCTQTWTTDSPSFGLIILKWRLLSVIVTDCSLLIAFI